MPLLDNYQGAFNAPRGFAYSGGIENQVPVTFDYNWIAQRRPYLDERGYACVTVNTGKWTKIKGERFPVRNRVRVIDLLNRGQINEALLAANATTLRPRDWIELDRVVTTSARLRMRAWSDLAAANSYGGFNGFGKMTLEYEAMNDPGEAVVDMDGIVDGRTDSPLFKLRSLPLPITHSDFWFSERRLAASRNSTPLDTTMAEAAGTRVGEMIEKTTIGVSGGFSGFSYGAQGGSNYATHDTSSPTDGHGSALGASSVYGYTTFPHRLVKTNFSDPSTAPSWVANTTYNEILAAINQLAAQRFHGPFVLYHSSAWSQYMNQVFSLSGGNNPGETLRTMLMKIEKIQDVRELEFLGYTDFVFLLVQMQGPASPRAINGMSVTTVQWQSQGGMRTNYKVMGIQVPNMRSDYEGRCGILHGTTT